MECRLSRFAIVGLREERCRPYENISIWVRCLRGQNFATGKLFLHVTPWMRRSCCVKKEETVKTQSLMEPSLTPNAAVISFACGIKMKK